MDLIRQFLFGIFILNASLFLRAQDFDIYLFIYSSGQTQSGAGHISMAFGLDSNHLVYYTKYRKVDGGGYKADSLSYSQAYAYDSQTIKHQKEGPCLVFKLRAENPDLYKLEKLSDHWIIKRGWSLFVNNCTDAVKKVLRITKINPGIAFLISTPNELVEDLFYHSKAQFDKHHFTVVHGDLMNYLVNEPNAVPQTLFGKKKH